MVKIRVHARGVPGIPENHAAIPVWNSEDLHFEDFEDVDKIRPIRRTISEGESILVKSLVMDHRSYVSDERFAAEVGASGKRLVAGAEVFSNGLGLTATNFLNRISCGYDRLRFIAPVFIGDTTFTIRENLSKEVKDREMRKVRVSYSVFKGEGEHVPCCEHPITALDRNAFRFTEQADTALEANARG